MNPVQYPKVQKGGSKRELLHLALPFISSLQVIVHTSKFGMQIDHSKSQPRHDKLSLKGAWSWACGKFRKLYKIAS